MPARLTLAAAVLTLAAAAGACSSRSTPAAAPATTTVAVAPSPTPVSSPSPSPGAVLEPCRAAGLRMTVGSGSGGVGSTSYTIWFTNVSASACTLDGYPGVSLVKHPGGKRIGAAAQEIRWVPRKLVTVARDGSASVFLTVANVLDFSFSSPCSAAAGHWLKVYPPGQFRAQYARRTLTVCTVAEHRHDLAVSAVRPAGSPADSGTAGPVQPGRSATGG